LSGAARPEDALTPFTRAEFCAIWAESHGLGWSRLERSPEAGVIVRRSRRLGLAAFDLGPRGLCWGSATGEYEVDRRLAGDVLALRRRTGTVLVTWNRRFDEGEAGPARGALGGPRCRESRAHTHVLPLEQGYPRLRAERYRPTTRRKLRLAERDGLDVRPLHGADDLARHAELCRRWAARKGLAPPPPALFPRLVEELPGAVTLWGAWEQELLVAAVLVFRDPGEWLYWHGVRDMDRDADHASYALIDRAIREACAAGVPRFNLGASAGIPSLEFFKERWGAEPRPVWQLQWGHRLWEPLVAGLGRLRAAAGS
jgi:hypothetical protein